MPLYGQGLCAISVIHTEQISGDIHRLSSFRGVGGGVLPSYGLLVMCRWMGSHFHELTDYIGVAFSTIFYRVIRMGSHIFRTLRVRKSFSQK